MPKLSPEAPEKKLGARATSQTVTTAKRNDGHGHYVVSQTRGGERGVIHAESRPAAARSLHDAVAWVFAGQYDQPGWPSGQRWPGSLRVARPSPSRGQKKTPNA